MLVMVDCLVCTIYVHSTTVVRFGLLVNIKLRCDTVVRLYCTRTVIAVVAHQKSGQFSPTVQLAQAIFT